MLNWGPKGDQWKPALKDAEVGEALCLKAKEISLPDFPDILALEGQISSQRHTHIHDRSMSLLSVLHFCTFIVSGKGPCIVLTFFEPLKRELQPCKGGEALG